VENMGVVISSDNGSNTVEIPISSVGTLPIDNEKLKGIGLIQNLQYWNYAFIINNHSAAIKVIIGKDVQYIAMGDAFEWGQDKRVVFDSIVIEEVGAVAKIDVGDIIYNIARLR